jgi:hypothetical protein
MLALVLRDDHDRMGAFQDVLLTLGKLETTGEI